MRDEVVILPLTGVVPTLCALSAEEALDRVLVISRLSSVDVFSTVWTKNHTHTRGYAWFTESCFMAVHSRETMSGFIRLDKSNGSREDVGGGGYV